MIAARTGASGRRRNDASREVLLVEDNPGDARLVEAALVEAGSELTLRTAADGVEAMDVLARRRDDEATSLPALVLLDLDLPRMDGFDVLDAIRDDSALSYLPVLVLTNSDDRGDVLDSYDRLANAYMTKPTTLDEFVALVRTIEEFWVERAHLPPA